MGTVARPIDVYLEIGKKRIFAGAVDWPGWCRSGRDEESALATLLDYGVRYRKDLGRAAADLRLPAELRVVERLKGDATTDFGAPGAAPSFDDQQLADAEVDRLMRILKACWS